MQFLPLLVMGWWGFNMDPNLCTKYVVIIVSSVACANVNLLATQLIECEIWIFIQIPIRSLAHSFCGQLWICLPHKIGEMKPWIWKIFSFGFIEFSMTKLFNIW
jgi:hypothetical protein